MENYALPNSILIGSRTVPVYRYTNRNIVLNSAKGTFSLDTIGNELAVDQFSFTVRYNADAPTAYSPTDADAYRDTNGRIYIVRGGTGTGRTAAEYLTDIAYGTPVWWDTGTKRIAKGYVQQIERINRYAWTVTCMSGIGLLDDKYHVGGIYNGATVGSIFEEIVGDAFSTRHAAGTSGAEVWNTRVYGWLPYDKARANLHRLLFAVGASMLPRKGASSIYDYELAFLGEAAPISVPTSRVSLSASVTTKVAVTGVEVTEHGFSALSSGEVVTLYDNTQGDSGAANELMVIFSEPIQVDTLTTTETLSVVSAGVNFAVVSGTGTLTGKKYTHSRSIVSVGDTSGTDRQVKRVTDNCLVSTANSINVANRVLAYFRSAKAIKSKILLDNEAPGDNLTMIDGFGDEVTAYVSKIELLVTSVRGASCELIADYVPDDHGNNFENRDLITTDGGTWTATKDGVIKVVLIQPGTGGQGGWNGHDGAGHTPSGGLWGDEAEDNELNYATRWVEAEGATQETYYWDTGSGGRQNAQPGGEPGQPGASGKILVMIRQVSAGEMLTFGIPEGGAGGAGQGDNDAPAAGVSPGETTVSSSAGWSGSTADGARSEVGYRDILAPGGGATYALPGENGIAGGYGGMSDTASLSKSIYGGAGLPGQAVGQWAGGKGGKGVVIDALDPFGYIAGVDDTSSGGGGGGAAYGANGGNGGNAINDFEWVDPDTRQYSWYIYSGKGGAGADALPPDQPTYGCGGNGGNGGGGGGNIGGTTTWFYNSLNAGAHARLGVRTVGHNPVPHPFGGGKGGQGSKGGQGGDGAAIVYS